MAKKIIIEFDKKIDGSKLTPCIGCALHGICNDPLLCDILNEALGESELGIEGTEYIKSIEVMED